MLRRQSGQALAYELCPRLLLQNEVWTVGMVPNAKREIVIPFDIRPASARGESFIASDGEEPGRDRSARLKGGGLPPNVEEHLAEQIFRKSLFVHETEKPPVNCDAMTCEYRLHREPIPCRDPLDQSCIGRIFACRCLRAHSSSSTRMGGSDTHRDPL